MSPERPSEQHEAQIISLVERRNKEVTRLLEDLRAEVKITKDGIEKEFEDLKLLAELPIVTDAHIADNVIDLNQTRYNKELRERQSGWVADRKEIRDKTRGLIEKIKAAMIFLHDYKLKPVLTASHVLSESEINFNFPGAEHLKFTEADLLERPISTAIKYYIPDQIDYLVSTDSGLDRLIGLMKVDSPNSQELKSALLQLHFQLQNGLKYAEYFLQIFEKNNPK